MQAEGTGQTVWRGPYVCLAAHCDLLAHHAHRPHPYAVLSADTVTGRTMTRVRFDTPTPCCVTRLEHCMARCDGVTEDDVHDTAPAMRVAPFTSDILWPSVGAGLPQTADSATTAGGGGDAVGTMLGHAAAWTASSTASAPVPPSTWLLSGARRAYEAYRYDFHHETPTSHGEASATVAHAPPCEPSDSVAHAPHTRGAHAASVVHPSVLRRVLVQTLLILQLPHRSPGVHLALRAHHSTELRVHSRNDPVGQLRFSVLPVAACAVRQRSASPSVYELCFGVTRDPAAVAHATTDVVCGCVTCTRVVGRGSASYGIVSEQDMDALLVQPPATMFITSHSTSLDRLLSDTVLPSLLTIPVIDPHPEDAATISSGPPPRTSAVLGGLQRGAFLFYACVAHCTWVAEVVAATRAARLGCECGLVLLRTPTAARQCGTWRSVVLFTSSPAAVTEAEEMCGATVCLESWRVLVVVTGCDAELRWRQRNTSATLVTGTLDALHAALQDDPGA